MKKQRAKSSLLRSNLVVTHGAPLGIKPGGAFLRGTTSGANEEGSATTHVLLLACIVGIPMYADIFGAIPIAEALLAKGAGLGTVISFMMSVTALSLPSMIMLAKAMKKKLPALAMEIQQNM